MMKFRKVTLNELVRVMSRDTGLNNFLVHRFACRFILISCSHNRMCEKHVDLFSFIKYINIYKNINMYILPDTNTIELLFIY